MIKLPESNILIPRSIDELCSLRLGGRDISDRIIVRKGKSKILTEADKGYLGNAFPEDVAGVDVDVALERIAKLVEQGIVNPGLNGARCDYKFRLGEVFDEYVITRGWDLPGASKSNPHILDVAPTHFLEMKGTDFASAESGKRFREVPFRERANPMGVDVVFSCRDDDVIVGMRSEKTNLLGGYWHVLPAGFADADYDILTIEDDAQRTTAFVDLMYDRMYSQLEQELGDENRPGQLTDSISEARMYGLGHHVVSAAFLFSIQTDLSADEVIQSSKNARDRWEYNGLRVLHGPTEVADFLIEEKKIVETGKHALMIYLSLNDKGELNRVIDSYKEAGMMDSLKSSCLD